MSYLNTVTEPVPRADHERPCPSRAGQPWFPDSWQQQATNPQSANQVRTGHGTRLSEPRNSTGVPGVLVSS